MIKKKWKKSNLNQNIYVFFLIFMIFLIEKIPSSKINITKQDTDVNCPMETRVNMSDF